MRRFDLLLACLAAWGVAGCGPGEPLHSATGRVSDRDGRPLADVQIVFIATARSLSASGRTDPDGRYSMGSTSVAGGVPAGDYAVVAIDDSPNRDLDNPRPARIAERYADPATSGLTAQVKQGGASFDFVLDPPAL